MTTIPRRALGLARELTLNVHHKTEGFQEPARRRFGRSLRTASLSLSLGLEDGGEPTERCRSALTCLWRLSDMVDHAERLGYLEIHDAMELLHLGSQVEVLLVPAAGLSQDREQEETQEFPLPLRAPSSPQTSNKPSSGR